MTGDTPHSMQTKITPDKPNSSFAATALGFARNPLGIIALFVTLIEGITSSLIFSSSLTHDERLPIIYFVVLFPLPVFAGFVWLVAGHSGKLFAPSDYKNEETYAQLQKREVTSVAFALQERQEPHGLLVAPSDTSVPPVEKINAAEPPLDGLWSKPQPDWDQFQYEFAMARKIFQENDNGVEEINQAYIATLKIGDPTHHDKEAAWKAFIEFTRLRLGKGGNLESLRQFADTHPNSSEIIEFLARGLLLYKNHAQAAATYEQAGRVSAINVEKLRLMGRAAVTHVHAGSAAAAADVINAMKLLVDHDRRCEMELLMAIREVAEASDEKIAEIAAMERMVEIEPGDNKTRFLLAYKHAQLNHNDIALMHYLEIPPRERDASAWNNIGVEFEGLGLSAKSIEAYRKSEEMGETLAMSNLAERLLAAGFILEAQQYCERALEIKDQHQNVGHTLARIKSLPDKEVRKEAEIVKKSKPKGDFYRLFGKAIALSELGTIVGAWRTPDCVIHVTFLDGAINGSGSYEQLTGGLVNALMSPTTAGLGLYTPPAPRRMIVEYTGKLQGRSVRGYVIRYPEGQVPSTLGATDYTSDFIMVLSDDASKLKVMETKATKGSSSGSVRFYSIMRYDGVSQI